MLQSFHGDRPTWRQHRLVAVLATALLLVVHPGQAAEPQAPAAAQQQAAESIAESQAEPEAELIAEPQAEPETTAAQAEPEEPVAAQQPLDLQGLMQAFGWDFDSAVVRAEKVSDGLFVLFGIGGNVAVSVGEQGTLIVDDQFPDMVPKLNKAITNLGGGTVDFVINTHWHFDHAEGNLSYGPEGSWLVSHQASRDMMLHDHNINLVAMNYKQQAYPAEALPSITFTDQMQFHFNGGQIDLLHFGPAHTTGDAAVFFRDANAVHLGDVFNRGYPFIDVDNGGDIHGVIKFCRAVHELLDDDTTVIPGHGELSNRAGLLHYIDMLQAVRDSIGAMVVAGASLEEVVASAPTAAYDDEFGDPAGFVNRAYTSLSKTHAAAQAAQQQDDATSPVAPATSGAGATK